MVEKRDGFLGFRLLGFVLARPDHPKPEKWDKLVKLKAIQGLLKVQNNDGLVAFCSDKSIMLKTMQGLAQLTLFPRIWLLASLMSGNICAFPARAGVEGGITFRGVENKAPKG